MQKNLDELSTITEIILKESYVPIELLQTMESLKALFLKVSRIDLDEPQNTENIHLENGKAIGPKWAAICLQDYLRTKQFICGVNKAVEDKRKISNNEPVTVLYSGTGPFATLVMPLITKYSSEELQFIFLEVNPQSFNNVKDVVAAFGAENYVKEMHQVDASVFQLSENEKVDILVVECLQLSLIKEPQVAISYNLINQLKDDVILIPEEIKLDISLYKSDNSGANPHDHDPIETVFRLNKREIQKHLQTSKGIDLNFPEKLTQIPPTNTKGYGIAVTTEITIYGNYRLLFNDSGLTIPLIQFYLENEKEISAVKTQYVCGSSPQLKVVPVFKS